MIDLSRLLKNDMNLLICLYVLLQERSVSRAAPHFSDRAPASGKDRIAPAASPSSKRPSVFSAAHAKPFSIAARNVKSKTGLATSFYALSTNARRQQRLQLPHPNCWPPSAPRLGPETLYVFFVTM